MSEKLGRDIMENCRIAGVSFTSLLVQPASCFEYIISNMCLHSSCQIDASVSEVVVRCELRGRLFVKMCCHANTFSRSTFPIRKTGFPPSGDVSSCIGDHSPFSES